ncbi:MAG: PD-(D/E)XK nuclease family protein [Oscillospiraceae bacterium]
MLRLILGRAKRGKTAAITESIARRVRTGRGGTVLLIPEQYSHEAERELLRVCGDSLCLYAEVLSFTRLCARVESELGTAGRQCLDKGGRLLAMALALDAVGSRLKVYGAARRQSQLQDQLLDAVDEFKTACVTPALLDEHAQRRNDGLGDKLADLSLIYGAYEAVCARCGMDPADRLSLLAGEIGRSSYAGGCYYIDGFTDFTAQQSAVIEALLRTGAEVTVCLTCQGLEESHEIFEPSRRAALKLLRLAESLGVEAEVTSPEEDPAPATPMAALEKELFAFGKAHFDPEGRIVLCYGDSIAAECEAAAARCLSLVRTTGCRWRDISIAVRGYEDYRATLEGIFAHYGVPLFSAKKDDLMEKPLPALIAAAFDTVTGGWDYADVFTCLKTGLAGLDQAECDELENYVFLWSIRGNAWTKDEDWSLHPDGFGLEYTDETRAKLRRVNALRRRAMGPLKALQDAGREAVTARDQAGALALYLEKLHLAKTLEKRAGELEAMGMEREAAQYRQLWDITAGALEQCAAILGDMEMDQAEFGRLFCLMLSKYDVGTIPLSLDKVSAGDLDRMRRRHIRHLIVLGADSSRLPRSQPAAGIFTDDDREQLTAAGLDIGDDADHRLYREFALLYNCLTLPEDSLSLSWCTLGEEGAVNQPSFVVSRAAAVFGLTPSPIRLDQCRENAPAPALELAARAENGANVPVSAAARRCFAEAGQTEKLKHLADAARLTRGRLSRSAVRALYGDELRLSASRVDKLSSCSFAYFLQYGLKARPRQAAEFAPPEMGTFMHFVLEGVAGEIRALGGFAAVTDEQVDALCAKYVERYVHECLNDFREKSPRFVYLFRRLTGDVRSVVGDMVAELRKSDFQPLDFELDFGAASEFPPIRLGEGEDSMVLTGIADRVDGWLHEGKLYVRVVDYKTGVKKFSLSDVWYGMGLQMLLYLFALERTGQARYGHEIVPAGVLYVPARDVLVSAKAGLSTEEILAEKAKARRRSGLVLDNEQVLQAMEHGETPQYIPVSFKGGAYSGDSLASLERLGELSRHIDGTLRALAGELRSGCIAADPYFRTQTENACRFCDYAGACHFDEGSDRIRYMTRLGSAQVWELLEKKKGGGDA